MDPRMIEVDLPVRPLSEISVDARGDFGYLRGEEFDQERLVWFMGSWWDIYEVDVSTTDSMGVTWQMSTTSAFSATGFACEFPCESEEPWYLRVTAGYFYW
jgi:hypothetical protein